MHGAGTRGYALRSAAARASAASLQWGVVLFVAFVMYNSAPVPLWNWIKLSDLLTIAGGLMFIVPFYQLSVRVKTREHAPSPWVWQVLPVVGMVLMIIGLLIPNDFVSFGAVALCDVLYFLGCVGMLMIFVYPLHCSKTTWRAARTATSSHSSGPCILIAVPMGTAFLMEMTVCRYPGCMFKYS